MNYTKNSNFPFNHKITSRNRWFYWSFETLRLTRGFDVEISKRSKAYAPREILFVLVLFHFGFRIRVERNYLCV